MKKAFIITSAIEVDNSHPLTYSAARSHFSNEERFRQTIFTIASLDAVSNHETIIFLVDLSDNYPYYRGVLGYQQNLVFVSVKEEFPEIFQTVRSHPNKSYCETLILLKFFEKYKSRLKEFDFIFKISGRYFTDGSFNDQCFTDENTDKIFFKYPMQFDWNDAWHYDLVDRRAQQGNNKLHQYSTVLYGFGREHFDKFLDLYRVIAVLIAHPKYSIFDIETLIYFFTRDFQKHIVETQWKVYGWDGTNGTFLRY